MDINEFISIFNDCELVENKILIRSNLTKVIKFIKDNYHFDFLKNITAIDLGDEIELIYKLYSTDANEDVNISIKTKDEIESISNVFDSAVADEKEIYDLFGVKFKGNSELKRLYLPNTWVGHPLKKDYIEQDERLVWND